MTRDSDAGPASEPQTSVESDGMAWALKVSFRRYLRTALGVEHAAAGAGYLADGRFYFPIAHSDFDVEAVMGSISAEGEITFHGHGGLIDLTLARPTVALCAGSGTVSVMANGTPTELADVRLMEVTRGDDVVAFAFNTRLRAAATHLFDDVYPPGTMFDHLEIRLARPH
ncbi:HtaA domain-containing protein [Nocardioides sp. NPDC051685]|uniref:HtaA domain-containing protein n=1 Tax=Nocardioides sp. NPDC051685 TaxID=3364334 RepID=UPI0037B98234